MTKLYYNFKKMCILVFKWTGLSVLLRYISDVYEVKCNAPKANFDELKKGWSIIVITDGHNKDCLDKLIQTAGLELKDSPYEIIIVGPPNLDINSYKNYNVIHFPYRELLLWGVPGFISRKKNAGAKLAKYDKLAVSHDYVSFLPGWKKGFDQFGDFTVGTNIVLNQNGKRHRDWITFDYPGIGQAMIPYDKSCNKYQYLNGTYFVVKRNFFLENPIDEKHRWGEGEDVWWSMKIREKTNFSMNTLSSVIYSKLKPNPSERWQRNSEKLKLELEK